MKNNFDRVAPIYDLLAKFVFAKKLENIQRQYLNEIPEGAKILIVGGGTGKLLEWLPAEKSLTVTYLELSEKMLLKAKRRVLDDIYVTFQQGDVLEVQGEYEVVIAHFFLDCFDEKLLIKVLNRLNGILKNDGKLFVADFKLNDKLKDKWLSKLMHQFFRLVSNLSSKELKDLHKLTLENGFKQVSYKTLYDEQLYAAIYEK